jgi:hypothetical protein
MKRISAHLLLVYRVFAHANETNSELRVDSFLLTTFLLVLRDSTRRHHNYIPCHNQLYVNHIPYRVWEYPGVCDITI